MRNQLFNVFCPLAWRRPIRWILSGVLLSAWSAFAVPPVFVPNPIANQSIPEDTTNSVAFALSTTNAPLSYTFTSSDTSLLPISGLSVSGSPANQTFKAIPAADAHGTSVVSIIVTDSVSQKNTNTFTIVVTPVNDAPTGSVTNFVQFPEDTVTNVLVTVGDIDSADSTLTLVNMTSTNTALIANGAAVSYVNATTRRITLLPLTNAFGFTDISFAVSDGGATSSVITLRVEVTPVNDPPYLSTSIGNQFTDEDVHLTGLPLQIRDVDNTPGELTLTKSSSNTSLLLNSGIVANNVGGGTNFTVNINLQADRNGTSVVTFVVSDLDGAADSNIFNVVVDPVPDTSTVVGVVNAAFGDDVLATNIFKTVVIGDVDYGQPAQSNLNLLVSLPSDRYVTFLGGQTSFTASGSPIDVTTAISNLVVVPQRTGIIGSVNTETATIRVTGSDDGLVISTNVILDITVINTPPNLEVEVSPDQMIEGQSIRPFVLRSASDADDGDTDFFLTVEFNNPAQSVFGTIVPTNTVSGNATTLGQNLNNLFFQAYSGVVTGLSEAVDLKFTLVDGNGGSNVVVDTLTILKTQSAPSISGIPAQTIDKSDGASPFTPLPTVFVSDPDEGGMQSVRATLSLSNTNIGFLSVTNLNLQTPVQLTAALKGVSYTPIPGVLATNQSAETILTLVVTDALNLSTTNSDTRIRITSVNNAPRILHVTPENDQPDLILPAPPLLPFKLLGLSNDDNEDIVFTIMLDNAAKGSFSNLGLFSNVGSGVYQATGTVPDILNALTNLEYVLSTTYLFPVDDPGGTVFTLSASDWSYLTTTETLAIQVQDEPKNYLVTRTFNDAQPGSFAYALNNAGNNDVISFALPSYPAKIAMESNLMTRVLTRNLTIKGPGANLLTISGDTDGDNVPDRQLFSVAANVTMEGITLSHGSASYGGAVQVVSNGFLTLRNCAVVDSIAGEYGAGIDVDGGKLTLDGCFIGRNRLSEETGKSGAGVSVYSDEDILIINTTFSENVQPNATGDGGGALMVQDSQSPMMTTRIVHSTFAENVDEVGEASAVLAIGLSRIHPENSIFADESGRNLQVDGVSEFLSKGGNICDDSTRTLYGQLGESENVYLLDHATDETSTPALLAPLKLTGDPLPFYPLLTGSPAVDKAASSEVAQDQRGVIRVDTPDSGAIESDSLGRLVINEIAFDDGPVDFFELVVRRDSSPVNLSGYSLFVDGVKIHDFLNGTIIGTNSVHPAVGASVSTLIDPGFGMVIAITSNAVSMTSSSNPTPVVAPSVSGVITNLKTRGRVVVAKNADFPIAQQAWQGGYMDPLTGTNTIDLAGNSVSLAPQFRGFSLIPHRFIIGGPFDGADTTVSPPNSPSSPGGDALGTPFGQDNAEPLALVDFANLTEDQAMALRVVDNDFDGDGNDVLFIVDLSATADPDTGDVGLENSVLGASLLVTPTNLPLRGESVLYDARGSSNLQALAEGVKITDVFYYEILDFGSSEIDNYASGGSGTVLVSSVNHRLTTNDTVRISGADISAYNSVFPVVGVSSNSFAIPTNYVGSGTVRGTWTAQNMRDPTSRSEASVTVRVTGVNDFPVPGPDLIIHSNITEEAVVRLMGRTNLAGTVLGFDTDPVPAPVMLPDDLISNDTDIDSDDDAESLRFIGVLPSVKPISGYTGTSGVSPVAVSSLGHGLTSGDRILISGYGGHPSYNGFQTVTVIDEDTFNIPVSFVDNASPAGIWAILIEEDQYTITTDIGAEVSLTLRPDVNESHLIYDASTSLFLNGLQEGELYTNLFYYAVADSHNGVSIGEIRMVVIGLNDTPLAAPDPDGVNVLDPLVTVSNTLAEILNGGLDLDYTIPPTSGESNQVDLLVLDPGGTVAGPIRIQNIWVTDEATSIDILYTNLLTNDSDLDRLDELRVAAVDPASREGAGLIAWTNRLTYVPSISTNLNALSREELIVDTFEIVVTDMMTGGDVTSLVAVVVVGLNDTPVAVLDETGTTEDDLLVLNPVEYPTNNPALFDIEFDRNGQAPDDYLRMIAVSNIITAAGARVDIETEEAFYDPTVSAFLNELADWQSHTDQFSYTVTDGSFFFANDDEFRIAAGSSNQVLDLLANDVDYTDATGTPVIVSVGPSLNGGSVLIESNGMEVIYTPPAGFIGDDLFSYRIENDFGDLDEGVVLVRSESSRINGTLSAGDDYYYLAAGETGIFDVTQNDDMLPADGAGLVITELLSSTFPGQPVLTNNTFVYTATNGQTQLKFRYRVSGGASAEADVTVDIVERRGTLDVQDDTFSVLAGSMNNHLPVLLNDALITASTANLRIQQILTAPSHGVLTTNTSGTGLIYTPNADFIGIEVIDYLATDTVGGTGTGSVNIIVGTVSPAPDSYTVPISTGGVAVVLDVLSNDRVLPNPQGTLSITNISPVGGGMSSIGTVQISTNATEILFTAGTNAAQQEFTYVVTDASVPGRSATGRVTIAVSLPSVNANPDQYIVRGESSENILDVLSNDVTLPNLNKTYSVLSLMGSPSAGGTVSIVNNQLVYTPLAGFVGEERFSYVMSDSVNTDTAQVTVQVRPGDLFANADRYMAYYEQLGSNPPVSFTLPVLLNDRIQPALGQLISITGVGIDDSNQENAPNQDGDVQISGDAQTLIYTPVTPAVSNYIERFTYVISDGGIRLAEGQIEILVVNRTNALTALTVQNAYSVDRNSAGNILPVLENDNILPATVDNWTITGVSSSLHTGSVSFTATEVLYSPPTDFVGVDQFSYSVEDNFGGTGMGWVTVKVGGLPTMPDTFTVLSGSTGNQLDVLANDAVAPNLADEYTLASVFGAPTGAVVTLGPGNTVLYSPGSGAGVFPFTEQFFYRVDDDTGVLTTGKVTVVVHEAGSDRSGTNVLVVVQGQNDTPTITNLAVNGAITDKMTSMPFSMVSIHEVDEQQMEAIDVMITLDDGDKGQLRNLGAFVQTDSDTYWMTNVTAAFANAQIRAIVFDPTENRIRVPGNETTFFTISVSDNKISSPVIDTNSYIEVTAVNDAPKIFGTRSNQDFYYQLPIRLFSGVRIVELDDLEQQALDVVLTQSDPSHGFLTNLVHFSMVTDGVYQATGLTASVLSAELRDMFFHLPDGASFTGEVQITQFDIEVDDRFATSILDSDTSVRARRSYEAVLQPTNSAEGQFFGFSVDTLNDTAVVGAPNSSFAGSLSGTAFVYERVPGASNLWQELLKLAPSQVETDDRFGRSVSISGDLIAVGAVGDEAAGTASGAVYLFGRNEGASNQWGEVMRIAPTNLTAGSDFGFSLDLQGDRLVVGAPQASPEGDGQGSVFVYERDQGGSNAWGLVAQCYVSDVGSTNSEFGWSVSLSGDVLAVGAPENNSDPSDGTKEGSVFLLGQNKNGSNAWGRIATLPAPDPSLSFEFGWDVSLQPELLVVGAPGTKAGSKSEAGVVYVYEKTDGTNEWVLASQLDRRSDTSKRFGNSVSLSRSMLLVGAPENTSIENYGAAYLYDPVAGSTSLVWNVVRDFTRPAGSAAGLYGSAVSLASEAAIIGAPIDQAALTIRGYAFMYRFRYNNPPALSLPLDDQLAEQGSPFLFGIPVGTFTDPDYGDELTLSASFPSGKNGFELDGAAITGTPVNVGVFPVSLSASDQSGDVASDQFEIYVVDSIISSETIRKLWDLGDFGNSVTNPAQATSIWGGGADPDGDLGDNDQEYAFGGDPNSPDSSPILLDPGSSGLLQISFLRRTNDPALTYVLQGSTDMILWQDIFAEILTSTASDAGSDFEWVTLTVQVLDSLPILNYRVAAKRWVP